MTRNNNNNNSKKLAAQASVDLGTTRSSARLAGQEPTAAAAHYRIRPRRKQQATPPEAGSGGKFSKNAAKNQKRKARRKAQKAAQSQAAAEERVSNEDAGSNATSIEACPVPIEACPVPIEAVPVAELLAQKKRVPCRKTGNKAPRKPAPVPTRSSARLAGTQPCASTYSLRSRVPTAAPANR
jgi:hypothetical protein